MIETSDSLDIAFIKRSIEKAIRTVNVQSKHLKEYCGPLKDVIRQFGMELLLHSLG